MIAATKVPCPECGHVNGPDEVACGICGFVVRPVAFDAPRHAPSAPVVHTRPPACEPHRRTLAFLGAGLVLAPLFVVPGFEFVGWFLATLVHETGHCVVAWLAGCPAFPAISLAGHAMAQHRGQSVALCVLVWGVLAWLAWRHRDERWGVWGFGIAALLYPLAAFTAARETLFLLGGHVGELAFATIFFWRAFVAGFARSTAERVAYMTAAWFLLGRNLWLGGGLLWDDGVRSWYASSGSFGLTNDYIRVAGEQLHVPLGAVAGVMLLVTLAVLPVAWVLSRPLRRGDYR